MFIVDPEVANQVTVRKSLPKSRLSGAFLDKLLGSGNMVSIDGPRWKSVRSAFNPGFASGNIMSLMPYIVDAVSVFSQILAEKAKTGEIFQLEEVATRLTIDVITKLTMDLNLDSQHSDPQIFTTFRKQISVMSLVVYDEWIKDMAFRLVSGIYLWYNGRKLDTCIGQEIDKCYARRRSEKMNLGATKEVKSPSKATQERTNSRYIFDLAFDTYQSAAGGPYGRQADNSTADTDMNPTFRQSAIVQIKTFIFAGHDTTSSVISWMLYLLHKHPRIHGKVTEELNLIFGPTSSSAADRLRADPYLVNRLPYCTAVIKETMRIFPPASSMRYGDGELQVTVNDSGETSKGAATSSTTSSTYPTQGFHIWPVVHAIHRHSAYFPEPTSFVPERHLDNLPKPPFPEAKQFKNAWRPFEKGPRNCIGQELAMVELKIVMALVVREFDFEAIYPPVNTNRYAKHNEKEADNRRTVPADSDSDIMTNKEMVEGHRCYPVLHATAKPKDGMPGKIKRVNPKEEAVI